MPLPPNPAADGTVLDRPEQPLFTQPKTRVDLKRTTVRGVAATLSAQVTQFVLGIGSTAVLARLLTPADFGLVAMTSAFTAFIALFTDGGLATATVQRENITHEQISTLFWINVVLGVVLATGVFLAAPAIAAFYGEPRIMPVTRVLAASFLLSGLAVQHRALMRRQFRFRTLAAIDVAALATGVVVAVVMASQGFGYWSLVGMSVSIPLVGVACLWLTVPWRPSRPRRATGTRSMLRFGSDVLSYNVAMFLKNQADLILLGWKWGPMAVGFYEKAGRMLLLPLRQVNGPLAAVLIPALSRIVSDPPRLARLYVRALELLLGVTIPLVFAISLFADEVVHLWLGDQWALSADLFRLLTVAAIMAVMVSPQGWLLVSLGQTRKYRWIGLVTASVHITAFACGLPYGPKGVAMAYSTSHFLLFFPVWWAALRGTPVKFSAVLRASTPCLAACIPAALVAYALDHSDFLPGPDGVRTLVAAASYGLVYGAVLLGGFRRWKIYAEVIEQLRSSRPKLALS